MNMDGNFCLSQTEQDVTHSLFFKSTFTSNLYVKDIIVS